jgi:hypothetical protein
VIRGGNNSYLINRVLTESGRCKPVTSDDSLVFPGWEAASEQDSLYNLKWKPTSGGIIYESISKHSLKQLVNHIKGHHEITTKDLLFLNMKAYYDTQK